MGSRPHRAAHRLHQRLARQTQAPKLMIATPSYDLRLSVDYVRSLIATIFALQEQGVDTCWLPRVGDSLLPAARNILAAQFLASKEWSHLLWVDSDIEWDAADVMRLIAHDLDFVCGAYRLKSASVEYAHTPLQGAQVEPGTGLIEVSSAGTGFMLTKRVVYERMIAAYPEKRISNPARFVAQSISQEAQLLMYDFFPLGMQGSEYVGEDIAFCRAWRALGGKVLVDTSLNLAHYGRAVYLANPAARFRPDGLHHVTAPAR